MFPLERCARDTGLGARCWFARLAGNGAGDSGELGGVSRKIVLGSLQESSDAVIGNLIFNGLTVSSTPGFGSVGVSGKTVGTDGRVGAQLKSMGLISQSSPRGNDESSNGRRNSFQGAGLPMRESTLFSCEFGSGHKYRSISNRV